MLFEGAKLLGESGKSYLVVSPLGQANVWTAVDSNDTSSIVVIKEPGVEDTQPAWPDFQNELVMHELLMDCDGVRKQLDRIPPTIDGGPPMLVLEIFETTLWKARTKRPLSGLEMKKVMKDALKGLEDVHAKGRVYADLKMHNILVDGFEADQPCDPTNVSAKLGDLGIVMAPSTGKVQPVSYRAPEVYFKGAITSKADIWSWGLIYCHLLEAQSRFAKTGLYDDLETNSGSVQEREQAVKQAMSNDYEMESDNYFKDGPLPPNDTKKNHGDQWELLRQRGLVEGEVDFLRWLMRADPSKRPCAQEILRTGWLDMDDSGVAAGFNPPLDFDGKSSIEFDPKRSSPAQLQEELERKEDVQGSNKIGQTEFAKSSDAGSSYMDSVMASISSTDVLSSEIVTAICRTPQAVQDAIDRAFSGNFSLKRELSSTDIKTADTKRVHTITTDIDKEVSS